MVGLKDYVDGKLRAIELATTKSEASVDRRFEAVNEFRKALSDLSNTMLPRAEYNIQHQNLVDRISNNDRRIESINLTIAQHTSKELGSRQGLGLVGSITMGAIAGISVLTLIANIIIQHNLAK